MHTVSVTRDFVAQHFLIGGDWGRENQRHSHHYRLEVTLAGDELDQHGYLVDIVDVERALERLVERYRDQTLNDLPEFRDQNPSLERFARCCCDALVSALARPALREVEVTLWESELARASYRQRLEGSR